MQSSEASGLSIQPHDGQRLYPWPVASAVLAQTFGLAGGKDWVWGEGCVPSMVPFWGVCEGEGPGVYHSSLVIVVVQRFLADPPSH